MEAKERVLSYGAESLNDRELLSIITGAKPEKFSGVSIDKAVKMSIKEWQSLGLTKTQGTKLLACKHAWERIRKDVAYQRQITSSSEAAKYLIEKIGDKEQEYFMVLYLNRKNSVIAEKITNIGTTVSCQIDIKVILKESITNLASTIIVSHNHPSGNKNPSEADKTLTKKIKEAAKLIDVQLIDHIIVTQKEYYSFADSWEL